MHSSSGKLGRTAKQARDYVASVPFDRRYALLNKTEYRATSASVCYIWPRSILITDPDRSLNFSSDPSLL
jgi:hypothetical protein